MDIRLCFAERIKKLREGENLSQSELAEKIGVSRSSISFYEKAERTPDIETLYKSAEFFNVTVEYLLGMTSSFGFFSLDEDTQGLRNYSNNVSQYSKMLAMDVYSSLIACLYEYETFAAKHSSSVSQRLEEPLLWTLKQYIKTYEDIVIYLKQDKKLSSVIYKFGENVSKANYSSMQALFELAALYENEDIGIDNNK